jgi:hypothetical protein
MTVEPDPYLGCEPELPHGDIELWELHSELALVSAEVRTRARDLLPERNPYSFLSRPREGISLPPGAADQPHASTSLPEAVFGYALWRLVETARAALFAIGAIFALTLLAEFLH